MADEKITNMGVDRAESKARSSKAEPLGEEAPLRTEHRDNMEGRSRATAEYCEKLQAWMWQYYTGYVNWQSWLAASTMSHPQYLHSFGGTSTAPVDVMSPHWYSGPFALPLAPYPPAVAPPSSSRAGEASGGAAAAAAGQPLHQPQENGNAPRPGREYSIPSPLQRLLAEMVDFFILFFIKATIIITIMHLSGIKTLSHIVETKPV